MTTEVRASTPVHDVKMIIGGEQADAADGQTFEVVNPATGEVIAHASRWRDRRTWTEPSTAAQRAFDGPVVDLVRRRSADGRWRSTRRSSKQHIEELAQLESANVGKPISRRTRRGAGGGPRARVLRRRREQALRRDDPGQRARPRLHAARADRRVRADRALELPDEHGALEARAGARRRQHRRSSSPRRARR